MFKQSIRFDGRIAIVTGAGSGLGRAHAHELAHRGAKVVVNDLGVTPLGKSADGNARADAVVAEIKQRGGDAVASYDSVTDGNRIVEKALDHYGSLDILVNNAGHAGSSFFFNEMDESDWRHMLEVHLHGTFKTTRAAWPHLRDKGYGRVIFTASPGIHGSIAGSSYITAKTAMIGLAKALASESQYSDEDVHVNVIAPTAVTAATAGTQIPAEAMKKADPRYVSTLVALLCHESNTNNGCLFEAGGRSFYQVKYAFSSGLLLDEDNCTPEALQESWDVIENFDSPEIIEDTLEIIRRTGIDISEPPVMSEE